MFPYLEHFFHLLCITEPATVLISLVVLACFLFGKGNIESLREQVVPLLLVLIVGSIRMITSLVIDMIVSILAINRFILYYHNRKGDKYFKQFFKFIIYFEYLLTVLLALIGFQAYSQRETHWGHQLNDILPVGPATNYCTVISQVCHFLTTCFISLCTIPYFIARSCIFKKSMERESKTEQCIKYQTILVLSSKLIIYPSCLFWTQLNVGVSCVKGDYVPYRPILVLPTIAFCSQLRDSIYY